MDWGRNKVLLGCGLIMLAGLAATCHAMPGPQQGASQGSKDGSTNGTLEQDAGLNKDKSSPPQTDPREGDADLGKHVLRDFAEDQKAIWTSPFHVRLVDADWLIPLGGAAAAMFATDTEFSKHLSNSPSRISNSKTLSNDGLAALVAAGGGMYLWGRLTHNDHMRETGFLAGEAAIDSLAATYALKYALGRERPLQDNFQGRFWQGGDSFPSEHSSAAWSIAGIIGHEYPGPVPSLLAYGLAAAVSSSRITAKQHFPSDVLIGSALGWFVGREVYRHHHDPTLGGSDWETYAEAQDASPSSNGASSKGSPYVELDSWVYPAIERLAALGYIQSAYPDMRPWTRIECANLTEEAGEKIRDEASAPADVDALYSDLDREFRSDLEAVAGGREPMVRVESLYVGVTGIDGPPLNDSYHFGETIINNYGRPFQQGFNTYDGFSGYATASRFTLYVRGEYQHAPSANAYPLSVREAIAVMDDNPLQPAIPIESTNQFTLLDTYVGANADGWNLAFGKQSLWWGPGDGGAMLFSNNAEPIYMFRVSRITGFQVPLLSRILGPFKLDAFVGKLSGNQFPARPAIHGEKVSFKPTRNLELSFSRTAEFGGVGRPLTASAIWHSYVSAVSSVNYAANDNPGKRGGSFDITYRIPFIRDWLTFYTDSYSPDDPSPIDAPRRAVGNPGLYFSRIPGVSKLDLRFEAVYTNTPARDNLTPAELRAGDTPIPGGRYAYWDYFYHDLNTNKRNLIGSWIGRDGQGYQAWSTYHLASRQSIQLGYRHAKIDRDFIPDGETVNDGSVKVEWLVHKDFDISASFQYEKWLAPVLEPTPQTDWTSSVQLTFYPGSWRW